MQSSCALAIAVCAIVLVSGSTSDADFTGVVVEERAAPGCPKMFRVYATFDGPDDQLLAIGGHWDQPLEFSATHPLFNDGGLIAGLVQEDKASAPVSGPFDSWVTIDAVGLAGNDTAFSPGFAGGDGVHAVVTGTFFEEQNGGWFDFDPGSPATGDRIIIAQFCFESEDAMFVLSAWVTWTDEEHPFPVESDFQTDPWWPSEFACPWDLDGDAVVDFSELLDLLSNWGPCPDACCRADFDADGEVGFSDLIGLLGNWGDCP